MAEVQKSRIILIKSHADLLLDNNADADHVYMMFSATFPKGARSIAKTYMSADHIRIRVGRAGSSNMNITQRVRIAYSSEL